ncbi:hypothetical protein Tco_0309210 [Tanacetum coccineum]
MTVNRLVLEWEEKIKLHQDKEVKFDQWRSKIFNNKRPAPIEEECQLEDEGGVNAFIESTLKVSLYISYPADFMPGVVVFVFDLHVIFDEKKLEVLRKFLDDDSWRMI